jgi:hypothetical protein
MSQYKTGFLIGKVTLTLANTANNKSKQPRKFMHIPPIPNLTKIRMIYDAQDDVHFVR